MASFTVLAFQNFSSASLASFMTRACSISLTTPIYQEPIDMMTRMINVPLATKSPCFHSASSPYGFSMTSVAGAATGGAGFTTSTIEGAGLTSAAGGGPCGACAIASLCAANSVTIKKPSSTNHFAFMFALRGKPEVELDHGPGPLRFSVDNGRLGLAIAQPFLCDVVEPPVSGRALHFAFENPSVRVNEDTEPYRPGLARPPRSHRIGGLFAIGPSRRADDRGGRCRGRRNRRGRRGRYHRCDRGRRLHPHLYLHLRRRNERRPRRGELGRRRGWRRLILRRDTPRPSASGFESGAAHASPLCRAAAAHRTTNHSDPTHR